MDLKASHARLGILDGILHVALKAPCQVCIHLREQEPLNALQKVVLTPRTIGADTGPDQKLRVLPQFPIPSVPNLDMHHVTFINGMKSLIDANHSLPMEEQGSTLIHDLLMQRWDQPKPTSTSVFP